MRFDAVALARPQFDEWLGGVRAGVETLDGARFRALARPAVAAAPLAFAHVAPGLFQAILADSAGRPARAAALPATGG
jgi:hypothetical protein